MLFVWETSPRALSLQDAPEGTVEVELLEGPPSIESAPLGEPAEPEDIPQPVPEVPLDETLPERSLLEQPLPTPSPVATQKPLSKTVIRKQAHSIAPAMKTLGNASSTGDQRKGSPVGASGNFIDTPTYTVKPSASYPMESRAAKEEGIVVLRITVNASGRPTNVRILSTSGYPRLDRAAQEGGWRCRIRNASAGDQFDAPMRFNINR